MSYIIAMLVLMAGCYFWIINAGAVSHAIREWTRSVRDPGTPALRFDRPRKSGVHPVRSPE